jgi:hypothetical protein
MRSLTGAKFDWCQDKLEAVFFGCTNNNRNSNNGKPELMGKDHYSRARFKPAE